MTEQMIYAERLIAETKIREIMTELRGKLGAATDVRLHADINAGGSDYIRITISI